MNRYEGNKANKESIRRYLDDKIGEITMDNASLVIMANMLCDISSSLAILADTSKEINQRLEEIQKTLSEGNK